MIPDDVTESFEHLPNARTTSSLVMLLGCSNTCYMDVVVSLRIIATTITNAAQEREAAINRFGACKL
jgi:hypothetical protein